MRVHALSLYSRGTDHTCKHDRVPSRGSSCDGWSLRGSLRRTDTSYTHISVWLLTGRHLRSLSSFLHWMESCLEGKQSKFTIRAQLSEMFLVKRPWWRSNNMSGTFSLLSFFFIRTSAGNDTRMISLMKSWKIKILVTCSTPLVL